MPLTGPTPIQAATSCVRIAKPVPRGEIAVAEDFDAATCGSVVDQPFVYDTRARAPRASRDLAAGEVIATLPASSIAAIKPGQHLYVRVQAGPVIVEREVEAIQSARAGERLFVKTADGKVFAVQSPEARP